MKKLEEREKLLHKHEIRTDKKQLTDLLHPDFIEIGYSGKTWDYNSTIKACLEEKEAKYQIYSQNYSFTNLNKDIIQVFYEGGHISNDGKLSRCAKRMSIWMKCDNIWKMRYHQATPVNTIIKL